MSLQSLQAASGRRAGRAAGGGGKGGGAKFELTEEQKQEIREAFDLFDTDGSGKLDAFCPCDKNPA